MITQIAKVLSHTVLVHIYSYPQFSIELFLAAVVCVVHCLLIIEVNSLYRRTNVKALAKLKMRRPAPFREVESYSYHTISRLQTQISPEKIETVTTRQSFYVPPYKRLSRKISTGSNFSWIVSQGDTLLPTFNDRVEHLLSISPSEYVRKDKERKSRQAGLKTCIESLTTMLEKALNNDALVIENLSKDALKNSINALRQHFGREISRESFQIGDFGTPSIQSMIADSVHKKALRNSLYPHITNTDNQDTSKEREIKYPPSNNAKEDEDSIKENGYVLAVNKESSDDFLRELFEEKTIKVLHATEKIPLSCS